MGGSPPSTYFRFRRALGRELRGNREAAGISGNQFAKNLGWAQSKVSRLETGAQIPTEADLGQWCKELHLSKDERGRLLSLLHQAEAEYRSWRDSYALAGGAAGKQREILLFERRAAAIREFQPSLIPGLLQTEAYASELLRLPFGPQLFGATAIEIDEMVAIRLERQRVLYDPSKKIRVIVLEPALSTRVCSTATLSEQLRRLAELCTLRSLSLGVVPADRLLPLIPLGGYVIYDDDVVILETLSGEQQLSSPEEVARYRDSFEALSATAVWSHAAAEVIEHALSQTKSASAMRQRMA